MKILPITAALLLSGCALTHEQVVERAHQKSTAELCMALIQFPQYSDEVETELANRGRTCDMQVAAAQVAEQNARKARIQAAIQAATTNNAASTYKIVPPVQLPAQTASTIQIAPVLATAYFTGQQKQVQTVTYQSGWNCEYRYSSQTFWRTFVGTCPASVQVQ